jgi:transposase
VNGVVVDTSEYFAQVGFEIEVVELGASNEAIEDAGAISSGVGSGEEAECQLVEDVLAGCFLDQVPERLIGDKAYDSATPDTQMAQEYGIEMIAPNRRNRKHKTQDGRPLRRYRRRWKVERLFAWMQNYRRLVTRWEYHIENFLGFAQLACLMMLLRHL